MSIDEIKTHMADEDRRKFAITTWIAHNARAGPTERCFCEHCTRVEQWIMDTVRSAVT